MPDLITIQSLTSSDRDTVLDLDQSAFGFDRRDLDPVRASGWIEWDRAFGATREGTLGGIYAAFSFGLSVPAGPSGAAVVVPMAGLSWVAVHPDHRRRGLLDAMMRHHLGTVHERGREPISCLFASEAGIYGRYGYGVSTQSRRLALPARSALRALPDLGGVTTRFEPAKPDVHDGIVKQVYDAAALRRPGYTDRPPSHWEHHLADPVAGRPSGAEELKIVVAERDGAPTGYAILRRTQAWGDHGPDGKVRVRDLQAVDPISAYALCRRVLDLDLTTLVTFPDFPVDHPLTVWAQETSGGSTPGHSLWTRIVDLDSALTARGYAEDLDLVLEVADAICPRNAGRWRLVVDRDRVTCERTTDAADLGIDIRELGSVYLGGTTLAALHAAGLVDEQSPGAVERASTAFRSALSPATPYMF